MTDVGVLPAHKSALTGVSAWRIAAIPFTAGLAVRVLLVACIQLLHGNFLFLDDQGYDRIGWSLAQAWHMNTYPSPGSIQYAGTISYLYYVFVGAAYYVFGHHWIMVKLIAALLSALSVPAAAAIGLSWGGSRLGIRAAWLAALYPNGVFWGATGLKDGPFATLLLVMAAIALRPPAMRRIIGVAIVTVVAFLSRPVLAVSGLSMLVISAAEWSRRNGRHRAARTKSRLPVVLIGIPGLVAFSIFLAARYLPILEAGLGDTSAKTVAFTLSLSPSVAVHALLGPFPWSFGAGTDAAYMALYPGMLVWIFMLPAIALGCWELIRCGPWSARGIVVSALTFLYLYATVFQAQGFFRQRYTVEILLLVIGLYAFQRFPQRAALWTAIGACVIAPAALVQAQVLPVTDLALMVIAFGVLWLAANSATVRGVRR
jgi:pimeloyl-ACP methyl ester carboxylesterase